MLTMERGLPAQLHNFINRMKQVYTMELIYSQCRPLFYHQYALSRLKKEGYKMAVCSNSIRETLDLMLSRADLLRFFEFTLSNQDVNTPKPDPEIYNKAIEKIGVPADQCMIIEDNQNGVKAAKAAGAHLLHVRSPSDVNEGNIFGRLKELDGLK
jgi:beta-phosphoglucomutase-like phosphatase (HAD superfamily)